VSTTTALRLRRSGVADITVSVLLLPVHVLLVGLTLIVAIAWALSDPIRAATSRPARRRSGPSADPLPAT
jgi:hypothetical protein